jgi:hypothetical protein
MYKEELFMVIFFWWCVRKGISYEEIESYLAFWWTELN